MSRTRRLLATILPALAATMLVPAPVSAAEYRGPTSCATTLSCSAEEINLLSMAERIEFVQAMSTGPAAALLPGYAPRWRNIEGVIDFFRDEGIGEPGSWISYVDAGILEGIERGLAIALGRSTETGGNPGSELWARYLTKLANEELTDRADHDRAWSIAEQASTEYGVKLAEQLHGIEPTRAEQGLYEFSEVYRLALRNRPVLYAQPVGPNEQQQVLFINWFTDVTNSVPARQGTEFAYRYSQLKPVRGTLTVAEMVRLYANSLWDDFLLDTTGL